MPLVRDDSYRQHQRDCLVWLGHASYFIRLNGVSFLIDPVLGDLNFLIRRHVDFPINISDLQQLDYILVSHDHRDHCDARSLRALAAQNPQATVLTGLNMAPLLRPWMPKNPIQAAGWYQQYLLATIKTLNYGICRSRHWGRRVLNDINKRLWGAYLFRWNGKTLYWGGDSGFGGHFEQTRALFGEPDYYLAGVGAFRPEWFMGPSHQSPKSAVSAAGILGARQMLPMHFGTFDLSDEPLYEPLHILESMRSENPFVRERLRTPAVGEVVEL